MGRFAEIVPLIAAATYAKARMAPYRHNVGFNMWERNRFEPRHLLSDPRLYRAFQNWIFRGRNRLRDEILRIQPGQRVLDIGCGPAQILDLLPERIDYVGFDAQARYIEEARNRYGSRGSFFVRAVTPDTVDDLGTFDVVMALGVLHHLDDVAAETVFASAARVLRPNGRLVTTDPAFVKGQNPIAVLLLKMDRGHHIRSPDGYLALARRHFPSTRATIYHDALVVPYTHCVMEARAPELAVDFNVLPS